MSKLIHFFITMLLIFLWIFVLPQVKCQAVNYELLRDYYQKVEPDEEDELD